MNDKTELERFEAWWNSEFKGVYYTDGKQYARHAYLASAASREAEIEALRAKLALAHTDAETIHKKRNEACAELEMRNILLMQLEAKLAVAHEQNMATDKDFMATKAKLAVACAAFEKISDKSQECMLSFESFQFHVVEIAHEALAELRKEQFQLTIK